MRELDGGKEFVISAVVGLGEGIRGLRPHLAAPKMIILKAPPPRPLISTQRGRTSLLLIWQLGGLSSAARREEACLFFSGICLWPETHWVVESTPYGFLLWPIHHWAIPAHRFNPKKQLRALFFFGEMKYNIKYLLTRRAIWATK